MQVRILCAAFCLVAAASVAYAVEGVVLAGDTLRSAVAGKTVYISTPVGSLPINYKPNGTMVGKARQLAQFVGSDADTGSWWIVRDRLCQQWTTWLDGRAYCYTMRRSGETVHWSRNDGSTGTAVIAN